mgnify:FL=1
MARLMGYLLVGATLSFVAFGCAGKNSSPTEAEQEYGLVLLKVVAGSDSPFRLIADSAVITVSAPDMDRIVRELAVTDSSVEGSINGIPVGDDRKFTIDVFDSASRLQYTGFVEEDVSADSTTTVRIVLYRLTGAAYIIGRINDTVTVQDTGMLDSSRIVVSFPPGRFMPLDSGIALNYRGHAWDSISPSVEDGDYFFWKTENPDGVSGERLGKTTFEVAADGQIWLIVHGEFGGGGNSGGEVDWTSELTTQDELESDGWADTGLRLHSSRRDGAYPNTWMLYKRDCTAGETFTYRTRKYSAPSVVIRQ